MLFVNRISIQHFVLGDQAARAFGEEHLVAKLDRRLHLAALDEVGVGLEDRIDLFGRWYLLAVEHAAARLIDHTGSQATKVLDLLTAFPQSPCWRTYPCHASCGYSSAPFVRFPKPPRQYQ